MNIGSTIFQRASPGILPGPRQPGPGVFKSCYVKSTQLIVCLIVLLTITGSSAENSVIKNGDFQSGNQYWTGDGSVITLADGNRVGQIKANDRQFQELEIEFELGDLNEMEVRFQARYTGTNRKMRVKVETRGQGALMYSFDLPEDGSWRDCKFNHIRKPGVKKFDAVFQALLGEGTLQIDNVWGGKPGSYTAPPKPVPKPPTTTTLPTPAVSTRPIVPVPMQQPPRGQAPIAVPPGIIGSVDAIIGSIPVADLQEMLDPATAQTGVKKVNAFLKSKLVNQSAQLDFEVKVAEPTADGTGFRIHHNGAPVSNANGRVGQQLIWAYFKDPSKAALDTIKTGDRVTIQGKIGRCDFVIGEKGSRFNLDLRDSKLMTR